MKNIIEKSKDANIIEREHENENSDELKIERNNLDFSNQHNKYVETVKKEEQLLIEYFIRDKTINNSRVELEDDFNIDPLVFDVDGLIKEYSVVNKLIIQYQEKYSLIDLNSYKHSADENINIEALINSLIELEDLKDKFEAFNESSKKTINQINKNEKKLTEKKKELENLLYDLRNKFFVKLFKKNEIKGLEKNILDIEKELLDQELLKTKINNKLSNSLHKLNSIDNGDLEDFLITSHLNNIKTEVQKLENNFISEEIIENVNKDYINDNVVPYLFNFKGNKKYKSEMNDISQEDKDIYLEVYKKYFSLERGSHADFHGLDSKEVEEKKKRLEIFNKVEHKLKKTYLNDSSYNKFELYQLESNAAFNDELKRLIKVIFSEFYNIEKKAHYLNLKKYLDNNEDGVYKDYNLLKDFEINNINDFENIRELYPYIKKILVESNIFKKENINQIEDSIIEKLFNKYILNEEAQGGDGQKAFGVMNSLNNKKSIPFFIEYIKKNDIGHTRNSCLHYLITATKELSDSEKENILKNLNKQDQIVLNKLIDKNSYLYKYINPSESKYLPSAYANNLIAHYLKDADIFELQEKISLYLEKIKIPKNNIIDFYSLREENTTNYILKYIESSGENKEEVLRKYQEFYFLNNINIDNFIEITKILKNYEEVFELILNSENYRFLYHKDLLKEFGYQRVANKLIEIDMGQALACTLEIFEDLDHKEVANKLIEVEKGRSVIDYLEKFENIDHKEIADKLIEVGLGKEVIYFLKKFNNLDHREIANKIIEAGEVSSVIDNFKMFNDLNHQEIADKSIEHGKADVLAYCLSNFKNLNEKTAYKLLEHKEENNIAKNLESFEKLSNNFGKTLLKLLIDFNLMVKVNEYYNPPLDKIINKTSEIFGSFANFDNFNLIKGVYYNDKDVIEKLKLKKGGNDGLRELQERFISFKKEIISEDFNPDILLKDDTESLYLPYFKSYIRYEESQWGIKSDGNFKNIVKNYIDYNNKGEIKKLKSNLKPSKELLINKSDSKAQEKHIFNEHFLNRFSTLINSIKKAKNLYQEKFPLTKLVEQIEEKRQSLIKELQERIDKMPNPQAKEGIVKKIHLLESVNLRNIKDFQNNFSILAKNKEFNELLRQTVFLFSYSKNKQYLNFDLDNIDFKNPKLNDISWTLNFVDHITNQETMSKYFTDKKSSKLFNEITSTKAIIEEMSLLQNEGKKSKDKTNIQFVPNRGILTEFSGHIADACWASKYDSILSKFPNINSVIIRQNPETKFERLAGAFLLIETESKNGEPLLVVRGFNPIENLINSLSVEDFYKKTMEYLKSLAKKDNRRLAIVIDNHSAGAATNRPVLFNYLNKLSKELEAIDLKSETDTTFNGYNITRQTYLVD